MLPLGAKPLETFPASEANSLMLDGMSKISQCHQPLPEGAAGSIIVMAEVVVPSGAFAHERAGEISAPAQSPPLKPCLGVACPPTSLLFKVKVECAIMIIKLFFIANDDRGESL